MAGIEKEKSVRSKSKSKTPLRLKSSKKPIADERKLLQTVEFQPTDAIIYKYHGKLTAEYKEDLSIYNPTDSIVAFKLKGTSPKMIKICPGYGYLKPKGKVTIWVSVTKLTFKGILSMQFFALQ